jgi:hypothetical protein
MMSSETAATLRLANTSLRAWLVRLRAEPVALTQIQASDLQELLAELLRTSGCLRTGSPAATPDAELESEIAEYRTNLESLAKVLPSVQGRLLAERARIQIEQSHIAARKAWAEASRRTL